MAVELTLTNADIVGRLLSLSDVYSRATSGTTTTLVRVIEDAEDDAFNNYYMCFLNGANKGIDVIVTDYVANTGTFTLDTTLTTTVDNKTEFALLEVGFLGKMEEAFSVITEQVRNAGLEIDKFLTTSQLKEIHLYKTLDLICLDLYRDAVDEDMYWSNHIVYEEKYNSTFTTLKADYDSNGDGEISEDEKNQTFSYGILQK